MTLTTVRTAALFAVAATLTLGGCTMTTPADTGPQKTGQQLRTQFIADATAAIAASGLPDEWYYGPQRGATPWNSNAGEFLGSSCSTSKGETRQRFDAPLYHAAVGDPVAFANMMGDYWAEQGYIVSNVGDPYIGPDGDSYAQIRADRLDGSLAAGVAAQNKYFVLKTYTECSTDPTLDMFAGPTGYREFDMLEPDPYHPTDTPTITPYPTPDQAR